MGAHVTFQLQIRSVYSVTVEGSWWTSFHSAGDLQGHLVPHQPGSCTLSATSIDGDTIPQLFILVMPVHCAYTYKYLHSYSMGLSAMANESPARDAV